MHRHFLFHRFMHRHHGGHGMGWDDEGGHGREAYEFHGADAMVTTRVVMRSATGMVADACWVMAI
jgi:hypothetical protein